MILMKHAAIFFVMGILFIENYKDFELSDSQYFLLEKFRDKFRAFSDENSHPYEFIDTPEWQKITEIAKDVLKAFDYKKTTHSMDKKSSE